MKKVSVSYSLLMAALMSMFFTDLAAQNKAQIHVKRNQNGVKSEETREVVIESDQSIQEILKEMGVLDELGELKEGQQIEIRIDKQDDLDGIDNIELFFDPQGLAIPPLPEFAPAPPMSARPFLGVMLKEEINGEGSDETGVVITEVIEGTAASKSGLIAGDVLLKLDGVEVNSIREVIDAVQTHQIGDEIKIDYSRDGKKKKVKAVLGEKMMEWSAPSAPDMAPGFNNENMKEYQFRFGPDSITIFCPQGPAGCIFPNDSMKICQPFSWGGEGMVVKETAFLGVTPSDEKTESGVKVNVEPETAAEKMGLQSGDVIQSINGIPVSSFDQMAEVITTIEPESEITVKVIREGREKEITGKIGKRSVSGFDDFRIFHDFKGQDEGGNYFYDYEFDMDAEDIEDSMQQLLEELDRQQEQIEAERDRIQGELDRMQENREVVIIQIRIAEISSEEAEEVNKNANPKLRTTNDLDLEQISFYPNPNDGILNLNFVTTEKKPIKIVLYNGSGEMVYLEERSGFDGNYNKTIDISDEPNGTYYLQIMQDGKSYSKKIVKGR
ncbi:MAG: PDZ domain-containing protein [Flavobacteriales bacterium]|nr:PDZ domain-containing protein [Flavobacteriales bacterium]